MEVFFQHEIAKTIKSSNSGILSSVYKSLTSHGGTFSCTRLNMHAINVSNASFRFKNGRITIYP